MDSSQDSSSRHLTSWKLDNNNPDSRQSDTPPTTLDRPDSTTSVITSQPSTFQRQTTLNTAKGSSTSVADAMALLLPPGPSPVVSQIPFAVAAQAASLAFASFESCPSGLVGRAPVDLSSLNVHAPHVNSLRQFNNFGPTLVGSSANAVNDGWKATSYPPASTATSTLGLFIPSNDQNAQALAAGPVENAQLQLQRQPVKPVVATLHSFSSDFSSLDKQVPNVASSQTSVGISNFSQFQEPAVAASMLPIMPTAASPAHHHMLAYKQSLTDAHTERLGGLLGLQHPLPPTEEVHRKHVDSNLTLDADHQPALYGLQNVHIGNSPTTSMSQIVQATTPQLLPRDVDDLIMIVDNEDNIVWTSDSMRACAGMLSSAKSGIAGQDDGSSGWNAEPFGSQRMKVTFLLADEQAISWWQQACHEVRWMCAQKQALQNHTFKGYGFEKTVLSPRQCKRELVLRHRNQQSDDKFVQMTIVATRDPEAAKEGFLMVRLRTASIPTIAAVSSQPMMGSLDSACSPFRSSPSQIRDGQQNLVTEDAELRLLVSRTGLILRATAPTGCRTPTSQMKSSQSSGGARAIFALLGEGASMPAFGQSLVDVPRLAPLLHVIAQASVVGLAQTVKLKAGGRQITATVQPVLRSPTVDAEGFRRARPPAAKVWITLSAPSIVTRRSSSAMSQAMTGFGETLSGLTTLMQPVTPQQRFAALDRRHSEQVFRHDSPYQAKDWPTPSSNQTGNSPHTTSPASYAAMVQAASTSQSPSLGRGKSKESSARPTPMLSIHEGQDGGIEDPIFVNDSLSALMAQLQEENRDLRRQIEARRRRRQMQAQSFSQPFAQPFAQSFTPPQWRQAALHPLQTAPLPLPSQSPLSAGEVPGSCPTKLVYLP